MMEQITDKAFLKATLAALTQGEMRGIDLHERINADMSSNLTLGDFHINMLALKRGGIVTRDFRPAENTMRYGREVGYYAITEAGKQCHQQLLGAAPA